MKTFKVNLSRTNEAELLKAMADLEKRGFIQCSPIQCTNNHYKRFTPGRKNRPVFHDTMMTAKYRVQMKREGVVS